MLAALVVHRRIGRLTSADLVRWAIAALEAGLDSPRLRRLAGLELEHGSHSQEADRLFVEALGELGLALPDETAAFREHVRGLAREIVDGVADPQMQVDRIHTEAVSPLGHPPDLMAWCYAGDGLRPRAWSLDAHQMTDLRPIPEAEIDQAIRELAAWYLVATLP